MQLMTDSLPSKPTLNWVGVFCRAIRKIYWLPRSLNPGVLDFIVEFLRMWALTFGALIVVYLCFYTGTSSFEITGPQKVFYIFLFAFFEEAARYNFAMRSMRPERSLAFFFLVVVTIEFLGYFTARSPGLSVAAFALIRLPSVLTHLASSLFCFVAIKRSQVRYFLMGIAWHVFMNFDGISWVYAKLHG